MIRVLLAICMMLPTITMTVVATLAVQSCAATKTVVKTANDIAHEACNVFASARERELGMTAADWCNLQANLEPFLDVILSAERKAGISSGGEVRRLPDETRDDAPAAVPATQAPPAPPTQTPPSPPAQNPPASK